MAGDKSKRPGSFGSSLGLLAALLLLVFLAYALFVRFGTPRVDPLRESNPGDLEGARIQVEVLNGSGVDRLAALARTYLRERGFDVIAVGNYARSDVEESFILDHVGDRPAAEKVAAAIGLPPDRIEDASSPDALHDVSLVLGMDYELLKPYKPSP